MSKQRHGKIDGGTGEPRKELLENEENQRETAIPASSAAETLESVESAKMDAAAASEPPDSAVQAEAANSAVSWEDKYAELEFKFADLNDQYLRKAADFENFRKRMIREKQEITEFANQNLLLDLLPVIDDFERAIKSAETSRDFGSFYEGITMIEKRLTTDLEKKWGLKRFDSSGEPFDPNRHEALQMEKAAGISEAVVSEDYVKGYYLKDRVIRFAKVKVLMPETSEE